MKKHIFRTAAVTAALAGISLLASCGSGLLDTEDEKWETNVLSVTSVGSLNTNYGMAGDPVSLTVTLSNGSFSDELKAAVATASESATVDVTDYFDITFVDSDGALHPLLRSYSIAATSAVTETTAEVGSTAYVDTQSVFSAILNYKLSTNYTEASSGQVQITANANALASAIAKRSTTSIAYSFQTGSYALLAANATTIRNALATISADATTFAGLNACARISLPVPTSKALAAGDQVATATVGGKAVTVYSAADCVEEVGEIPVIFTSTEEAYSGAIVLTLDGTVANIGEEDTIDAESAVASNLRIPYYGVDFENVSGLTEVGQYSGNDTSLSSGDATYGTYAKVRPGDTESGNRSLITDATAFGLVDATDANQTVKYTIEFDLSIAPGGVADRSASGIALVSAAPSALYNGVAASDSSYDAVVVTAGFGTLSSDGAYSTKYYYEKSDGTWSSLTIGNGTWCHYTVNLTATYGESGNSYAATVSITDSSTGAAVIENTAVSCTALPSYLWTLAGRYKGENHLDNIMAYTPCGD